MQCVKRASVCGVKHQLGLQVVGESLRRGLSAAMGSAQDAGFAAPILEGFVTAIRSALIDPEGGGSSDDSSVKSIFLLEAPSR